MSDAELIVVTDRDGRRGFIDAETPLDASGREVRVRLDGGREVRVLVDSLVKRQEGGYFLPVSFTDMEGRSAHGAAATSREESFVVPVIEENLEVRKREIERGRVRLTKTVNERIETVDEPLAQDEVSVQRISVNRIVDGPLPEARYEGDTMIIPLLEEIMVMEKRVLLKEELHITKRQFETRNPQSVILRSEEVNIERISNHELGSPTPEGGNSSSSRDITSLEFKS